MPRDKESKIIDFKTIRDKWRGSISCCIIARDEEEFVTDAIYSVRDLVDEVIVVDTGSCDRTVSEAQRCGAKVYRIKWNYNFSEARNHSISMATKEWILILDADEAIAAEDHERIRHLTRDHDHASFLFDQITYTNDSSTFGWEPLTSKTEMSRGALGYYRYPQVRFFRNEGFIRYQGAVHESVETSLKENGIPIQRANVAVHHYGRLRRSDRIFRKSLLYIHLGQNRLHQDQGNTRYLYEMAAQLLDLGHIDGAMEHAKLAFMREPDNWEVLNLLGLVLLRHGRVHESVELFRKALESGNAAPELYNNLGVALMEKNEAAEALQVFIQGMELDGDNAQLLRNAALASLRLNMIDNASTYISKSVAIDPFAPQSHVIHAEILTRISDFDGVIEALKKIRFLPGTDLKVYLKSIHIYTKIKMIDKAEEILERAMEEYPWHDGLVFISGKIAEIKGDEEKAISIYKRLLAIRPGNIDVLNSLGCILERKGNLREALVSFQEAFRLDPNNLQVEVNLGIVMGELGMHDDAECQLREAVERIGDSGFACNALGCLLGKQSRYHEALVYFTRAVELEPENAAFCLNLAMTCERLHMYGKATAFYKKMALIDPSAVPLAQERLERLKESIFS